MKKNNEITPEQEQADKFRKDRREFLGKSKYAAYMTPLMLSMVVDKDAHAVSPGCTGPNPPKKCL